MVEVPENGLLLCWWLLLPSSGRDEHHSSDSGESTEMAHLVPRAVNKWFRDNLMYQYMLNVTQIMPMKRKS